MPGIQCHAKRSLACILAVLMVCFVLLLAGCNGADSTQDAQSLPEPSPTELVALDFMAFSTLPNSRQPRLTAHNFSWQDSTFRGISEGSSAEEVLAQYGVFLCDFSYEIEPTNWEMMQCVPLEESWQSAGGPATFHCSFYLWTKSDDSGSDVYTYETVDALPSEVTHSPEGGSAFGYTRYTLMLTVQEGSVTSIITYAGRGG